MFWNGYVKGVPFASGRYMKGLSFLSKMVYKKGLKLRARLIGQLRIGNLFSQYFG